MSLFVRDNRVIIPSLRDGAPTTGAISNMTFTTSGVKFTEVIDVGTFSEAILFANITTFTSGTLDAILQISPDGKNFTDMTGDNLTQITGAGLSFKKITAIFGKYIRFKLTGSAAINMVVNMYLSLKG